MAGAFWGRYRGKRVLVTGDTGFKGSWLVTWLRLLGAEVHGVALAPHTDPSLFERAGLKDLIEHTDGDVRQASTLDARLDAVRPDVVFHLAAQAIVSESYRDPVTTLETNILGTMHLFEALRRRAQPCAVVIVTSDKCYEDQAWDYGYRETDRLGGSDPYSASKACAEILTASYRRSFFPPEALAEHGVAVASVRAGNVLGPGDFALNRIVPDCVRALASGQPVAVRNPDAVRPWQHVLEPLSGYLVVGARLLSTETAARTCEAWNFGPRPESCRPVRDVVEALFQAWGGGEWDVVAAPRQLKETHLLRLSIEHSVANLGWSPVWTFAEAAESIAHGYRRLLDAPGAEQVRGLLEETIGVYTRAARQHGLGWVPPA